MYDLVLRSGRIVTPDGVVVGDLGLEDGKVAAIGQGLGPGRQEIDSTGRVIFPGIVDAHVHLGVPSMQGRSVDDVASGTRAAAFGGVTTVIDCTVQDQGETLNASVDRRLESIAGRAYVDVGLHCNVTSCSPAVLAEIPGIVDRGLPSLKAFTTYGEQRMQLGDAELLRAAQAVGRAGGLLMVHAENGDAVSFLTEQLVAAGKTSAVHHERSRPDLVEAEAIRRVTTLARLADCPLYIAHLSSALGLEVVRRCREDGWEVRVETCPQYLLLDKSRYEGEDGHRFLVNPPLRAQADRAALTQAVADGEIEVLASDHAPFSLAQKDAGQGRFPETPGGLSGVETLFPLMFAHLVALGDGGLTPRSNASLLLLARVLAENPAKLFGLTPTKGALQEGADADFFVFDPKPIRRLRAEDLHGADDWTPYEDIEVRGEIKAVYLRGERIVEGGTLYAKPGTGRFVEGRIAG